MFAFLFSPKQEAKLKAARMHIYVRRGGPNYQRGLAKMRSLGEEIGIPIEVLTNPKAYLVGLSKAPVCCIWEQTTRQSLLRKHRCNGIYSYNVFPFLFSSYRFTGLRPQWPAYAKKQLNASLQLPESCKSSGHLLF